MSDFNRKVVKIGTITVSCAIVANFLPVLYFWIVYGEIPTLTQLTSIFSMIFAASAVSWIVQPLSYYGGLGMVGTYIAWISGSAADIRLPAINMAQRVTNTEANTPEGDAIGAMALSASVFTTVLLVCSPLSAVRSFQCSLSLSLHHLPICRRHFSPQYS